VDQLAGLGVGELGVRRPGLLPGLDRVADERVDRLGERGRGLVRRDVEQADPLRYAGPLGLIGLLLPADRADA
jgi:hypothetical protein